MTQIKPTAGQTTPRFADIATFFRLPIIKDLNQLDYCICGIPWDGGTTNRPGARHMGQEKLEMLLHSSEHITLPH